MKYLDTYKWREILWSDCILTLSLQIAIVILPIFVRFMILPYLLKLKTEFAPTLWTTCNSVK